MRQAGIATDGRDLVVLDAVVIGVSNSCLFHLRFHAEPPREEDEAVFEAVESWEWAADTPIRSDEHGRVDRGSVGDIAVVFSEVDGEM